MKVDPRPTRPMQSEQQSHDLILNGMCPCQSFTASPVDIRKSGLKQLSSSNQTVTPKTGPPTPTLQFRTTRMPAFSQRILADARRRCGTSSRFRTTDH